MSTLTETLREAGYANRVFNERQLASILGSGDASRYGLVNRALKDGSLLRLKRGLYVLGSRYRADTPHPFAVAQALLPGSYISFETALAYHGWIPEAVYTTSSVTPARKSLHYEPTAFGQFTFHPLALQPYQFLTGVQRKTVGTLSAFVATPLRALLDIVALNKIEWTGLEWLVQGMRIDEDHLHSLPEADFAEMAKVYKHKAVKQFCHEFKTALESECVKVGNGPQ